MKNSLALDEAKLLAGSLNSMNFSFQSIKEAENIANFIAMFTKDPEKSYLGLVEIFINAIEHGNLGIDFNEKGELVKHGKWLEEIEKRLELPQNQDKFATVEVENGEKSITCYVTDQGNGFDFEQYSKFDPKRMLALNGRGISLASETSADELKYLGNGNKVMLKFHK